MEKIIAMSCRKCNKKNPIVFLAPVIESKNKATCVCSSCARDRRWIDESGKIVNGVEL